MNWDDEIDLMVESKAMTKDRQKAPKAETPKSQDIKVPEVRGGWSDDVKKSAKTKVWNTTLASDAVEDSKSIDPADDIPTIPDDDDIEDLLNLQEIHTPRSAVDTSIYKEIDSSLTIKATSSPNEGIKPVNKPKVEAIMAEIEQELHALLADYQKNDNSEVPDVEPLFEYLKELPRRKEDATE